MRKNALLLLAALFLVRCSDLLNYTNVRATKFGCNPALLKASIQNNISHDKKTIRAIQSQGFLQKDLSVLNKENKKLKMSFPIGAGEVLRDLHANSEIRVFGNLLDDNTLEVGPWGVMPLAEFHVFPAVNVVIDFSKKVFAEPTGIPPLSSLPGALATLYLDFDGHTEAQWGSYSNIVIPPYDQDNDPTTFSAGEIDNMRKIWEAVSEDYAPYNINVTTVLPPNFNDGVALRAAIGGNSNWTGVSAGGVAYVNSFTNYIPNVVFIFPKNLANGDPKNTAVAVSHEAGHAFGLKHQSKYDSNGNKLEEYSTGPGDDTAPLMGLAYSAPRSLWWYGPNAVSATTIQDDMAIISSEINGFRYRSDDVGNTMATATSLTVDNNNNVSGSGVISAVNDIDMFSFDTEEGPINLSINPKASLIGNLDLKAELFDSQGNSILLSDPSNSYAAQIQMSVVQGRYYLAVSSHGGYGNVGQYNISGSILTPAGGLLGPSNLKVDSVQANGIHLSWKDNSNNETGFVLQSSLNGTSWSALDTLGANTTTYTDTNTNPGTLYYYRVKAVNQNTSSNYSNIISATTIPAVPSFSATANSASMITLSWNDVTGETGYTLERSLNSTQWSVLTTPSANVVTYQNTGLTPSTLYYYRLKSENASGSSDYTSVSSARTHDPNSPPSAPTNLAGSIIGIGITLSWTDNSNNEDSFIVYRSVNNGPSTQLVELPANTTAYGDTQVQLGSNYKYSVKAKNAYGLSSASNDLPILMNCQ